VAVAAAAAGVSGAPRRPRLHRGSPRAHWPKRGDHWGRRPLQPPRVLAREGAEGGGPAPRGPAWDGTWRVARAARPPGGRAVCGFTHPPAQGRGEWPDSEPGNSLCGESVGGVRSWPWPPRAELACGASGKPFLPGMFSASFSPRPEIKLGPDLTPL
jgi:hypothetical protein